MTGLSSIQGQAWRAGYSLPQYDYISPAVYEQDTRLLGESLWLLVDHESRIPNPGDFFTAQFGRESVIVARHKDGSINAYLNVCRHRGSRICLTADGNAKALVCPYHGWTYGLGGELRGAPLMPADFDKEANGLIACHVRIEAGLIFINFSEGAAPDFQDFISPFRPFLAIYALSETRIGARRTYPTTANWKLLVENFFECYHCRSAHASYCGVHDPRKLLAFGAGPGSGDNALAASYLPIYKEWEANERRAGTFIEMFAEEADSVHFRSAGRMPIGDGAVTESLDGQPVAPLIGAARLAGAYDGNQTGMVFNPVSTVLVASDHAVIFRFIPTGPLTSVCEAIWLVHQDAREGQDFDPDKLVALWDITLGEDKTITENNQAGIMSAGYRPGRFSTQEQRIADFGAWYMARRQAFNR
jgi:Rieske 2Fe-2S family protein